MAELDNRKPYSLEELVVTTLAMTDALAKLLIEKGVITPAACPIPINPPWS